MSFYRVTYHDVRKFATLHNFGCTFKCPFCSYKLKSGANGQPGHAYPRPERFLTTEELKNALRKVSPKQVYFMGGEPTTAQNIAELLRYAKRELGANTRLGHTNGSCLALECLDGANVGFKAWSENLHTAITGQKKSLIYDNFSRACDAGLNMAANMIYIPDLVEHKEFEGTMRFLSNISPDIAFHIMGYIPVPGQPYRRPTDEEMSEVTALCRSFLRNVGVSHLTTEQALDLSVRDDRFRVRTIAG
ncbi:MAG: radical SAM protein [Victivallales bacterium]|jgi:pyruvate formate lyase activating enzyme|nr:radical SAM protein [Victivallales bacterium]